MPRGQLAFLVAAVLLAGCLGGAAAMWWQGRAEAANANPPLKSIAIKEINLVDDEGRVRAQLGFRQVEGALCPGLFLYDQEGKEKIGLTLLGKDCRPALALSDAGGETRLWLGLDAKGAPQAVLYDAGQQLRAALGAVTIKGAMGPEKRSASSLIMTDEKGKLIWQAP